MLEYLVKRTVLIMKELQNPGYYLARMTVLLWEIGFHLFVRGNVKSLED